MNGILLTIVISLGGVPRMLSMRNNQIPAHWIVSLREIGWSTGSFEVFTDPFLDLAAPNIGAHFNYRNFMVAGRVWMFNGSWIIKVLNSEIEKAEIQDASGFNLIFGYSYQRLTANYQLAVVGGALHNSVMLGFTPNNIFQVEGGYDFNASRFRAGAALTLSKGVAFLKVGVMMFVPSFVPLPVIDFGARW